MYERRRNQLHEYTEKVMEFQFHPAQNDGANDA